MTALIRKPACFVSCLACVLAGLAAPARVQGQPALSAPVPVILDTDIGDDIDDTWALGLLLKCPELDLKLVVGDYGRPEYRARLLAKFLQVAGRTDVAVGVGLDLPKIKGEGGQAGWVRGYELSAYPGKVHRDGVQALIDLIMSSPRPVALIAIGPAPNLAEALKREPRIADRARFFGMYGSVRVGYGGAKRPAPEWNVKADPAACRAVFTAAWDTTITPLDTCGLVSLDGERYRGVRDSRDPIAAAVIANYRVWAAGKPKTDKMADVRSSTLFDTVAVYLVVNQDYCVMERLGLRVTDEGATVMDPSAKAIHTAAAWKDLDAYRDWLVNRLTGGK